MSSLSSRFSHLSINSSQKSGAVGDRALKKPSEKLEVGADGLEPPVLAPVPRRVSANSGLPKRPDAPSATAHRGRPPEVRPPPVAIQVSPPGTPHTTVATAAEHLLSVGLAEDSAILARGYLRHDPTHMALNKVYGRALLAQGKVGEAQCVLQAVSKLPDGQDARTCVALAEALLEQGGAWEAAVILDCYDFLHKNKALTLDQVKASLAHNKPLKGATPFHDACIQAPRGKLVMSRLLRQVDRAPEAVPYMCDLLEHNSGDDEHIETALVAIANKDFNMALDYLLDEEDRVPKAPVALAEAQYMAGRHGENVRKFPMQAIADEPRLARFVALSYAEVACKFAKAAEAAEAGCKIAKAEEAQRYAEEAQRYAEEAQRYIADAELLARVALSEAPGDTAMRTLLRMLLKQQRVNEDDPRARLEPHLAGCASDDPRAFLVALAQRSGPYDSSYEFWRACVEYKAEAAFDIYKANYQDARDGSYALRMGEKLVDWQALKDRQEAEHSRSASPLPERAVMRRTVEGAELLKTASSRRIQAPSPDDNNFANLMRAFDRREKALQAYLAQLGENEGALKRFRTALAIPAKWKDIIKAAENDETLRDLKALRAYMGEAFRRRPEPTGAELARYFHCMGMAYGRTNPLAKRAYLELAPRVDSEDGDAAGAAPAIDLLDLVDLKTVQRRDSKT